MNSVLSSSRLAPEHFAQCIRRRWQGKRPLARKRVEEHTHLMKSKLLVVFRLNHSREDRLQVSARYLSFAFIRRLWLVLVRLFNVFMTLLRTRNEVTN